MNKKPNYIQVDKKYDELASTIAELSKSHDAISKKEKEAKEEFSALLSRLSLYIKNEFWNKYSFKKHTFLITKDEKLRFYDQSEMKIAKAKYDAEQEVDVMEDYDIFCDDGFFENSGDSSKKFYDMLDFLQSKLSKLLFECNISQKQRTTLQLLTDNSDKIEQRHKFILQKKDDIESAYADCMADIIDKLTNDKAYDFDFENDEIMSVRDEKTMQWHLIYYHLDEEND